MKSILRPLVICLFAVGLTACASTQGSVAGGGSESSGSASGRIGSLFRF